MSDEFLGAITLAFCIWGGMYGIFKFFTGGNLTIKPIVDNTILDDSNSKLRSFRIGKGMEKIKPLQELGFEQTNGQLFANAEYLSMGSYNESYSNNTSWAPGLVIMFFAGIFALYLNSVNPNVIGFYFGIIDTLITGIWLIYLLKLKYTESSYLSVRFERKTGLVIFPLGNGDKHFSVSIDDVELYTSKVSSGKGVMHRVAFLAPKKFPKSLWWQKLYTVSFMPRTSISAQILWTEVNHYMDKSRPIPKAFYRNWQELMEDPESDVALKKETLTPELYAQAPFYDRKNKQFLDKEFW